MVKNNNGEDNYFGYLRAYSYAYKIITLDFHEADLNKIEKILQKLEDIPLHYYSKDLMLKKMFDDARMNLATRLIIHKD